MKYVTTLNRIKAYYPCERGWDTLLTHLGKTRPDNEPVTLWRVLHSNGLEDAVWCLLACDDANWLDIRDRDARLFAVRCARLLQGEYDSRSHALLDLAVRHALGQATALELEEAQRRVETEILRTSGLTEGAILKLEAVNAALHASPVAAARIAATKALKFARSSVYNLSAEETATAIFRSTFCAEDSKPEPVATPAVPVSDDTITPPGDGWREASFDGDDCLDRRCEHLFKGEWIPRSLPAIGCPFVTGHRYRIPIEPVESKSEVATTSYVTGEWLDLEAAKKIPRDCRLLARAKKLDGDKTRYYTDNMLCQPTALNSSDLQRAEWAWLVIEDPLAGKSETETASDKAIPQRSKRVELLLSDTDSEVIASACELCQLHDKVPDTGSNQDGAVLAAICSDWLRRVASGKVVANVSTASKPQSPETFRSVAEILRELVAESDAALAKALTAVVSLAGEQPEE